MTIETPGYNDPRNIEILKRGLLIHKRLKELGNIKLPENYRILNEPLILSIKPKFKYGRYL